MRFRDYAGLLDRLKRDCPDESFLLVRYGDHQPEFASFILEPSLDEEAINRRLMVYDPRYFTTYYAIDTVNFKPANLSSPLDTIEGPYLPLVIQQAAALRLALSRSPRPACGRARGRRCRAPTPPGRGRGADASSALRRSPGWRRESRSAVCSANAME